MKKLFVFLLIPLCMEVSAQKNDQDGDTGNRGFDKSRLFTGGSANIGFSNGATVLGIAPQFGYSITSWADVGISFNLNYVSQRDYYEYGDKLRQTTYGPGAFVRLFPVNFLFAAAQYEHNFINLKYIPVPNSPNYTKDKRSVGANSFLVGAGYAGGRERGGNTYYFLSVMWDLANDKYSPYKDGLGRANPVIRAGYNIGLFQGRSRGQRY